MKKKMEFTQIYVCPDYGLNTLINGNISECIRYFNELIESDFLSSNNYIQSRVGISLVIDEMTKIKEYKQSSYDYILKKLSIYKPIISQSNS